MREFLHRHGNSTNFQLLIYGLISIIALILSGINVLSGEDSFQKYFGTYPPMLVMAIVSSLGGGIIFWLWKRFSCYVLKPKPPLLQWNLIICVLISSMIAILLDINVGFNEDINVLFPFSLLFYPAIGFLVEVLFHILPISVILFLTSSIFNTPHFKDMWWPYIIIVSLLEPTFQIFFMDAFSIGAIIIWLNIYFLNLVQLYTYLKFGFVSMYFLRIIYYLVWHVIWGYFRLDLLF